MTNEINTDSVDAIKESEMVNSPVPFDGVVNGDDQVNNIFWKSLVIKTFYFKKIKLIYI